MSQSEENIFYLSVTLGINVRRNIDGADDLLVEKLLTHTFGSAQQVERSVCEQKRISIYLGSQCSNL